MALFEQKTQKVPSNLLKDKYGWPPFSILNTISWDWQRRKDEWENVIHDSTIGRDTKRYNATPVNTFSARGVQAKEAESISTFDPYLCELMYRWFTVPNTSAKILDPFAGGCVRGEVASILGHNYLGIDLSKEQVLANRQQYKELCSYYNNVQGNAQWIIGNSSTVLENDIENNAYDMVFTCPPYYNLERYTDSPEDLSNAKNYQEFLRAYSHILHLASEKLKENSFCVVVVSEVRASQNDVSNSQYVGLVPDTIKILQDAGLHYYNEIILENAIGSLPIRTPKSFDKTRKIGRHHQNIIVSYKGDISNIENVYGPLV